METKPVFHRVKMNTYLSVGDDMIGVIERATVSNSSPRGGAYRTVHYAYRDYRKRGSHQLFYTRKEAAEWLLQRFNERTDRDQSERQ